MNKIFSPENTNDDSGQNNLEKKDNKKMSFEKIKNELNQFIKDNDFRDKKGELVYIERIIPPTKEDLDSHQKISKFLDEKFSDDEEMKNAMKRFADYLKFNTTFDSIKTKSEHSLVRRKIELELSKKSYGANLNSSDFEKYRLLHSSYYFNRLGVGAIERPVNFYEMLYDPSLFSEKTNKLAYDIGYWFEPEQEVDGVMNKRYELADDSTKEMVTKMGADFVKSFFSDLQKIS